MWNGYKSLGDLMAELKMTLAPGAAVLAVEGDDDMRFWRSRKPADCHLVDGEGKTNVVAGVRQLDASGHRGALGLVDTDYDTVGTELASANLVATDAHDLECLLCRSTALEKVLAEYGDSARIDAFERRTGQDVRTGLLQRALPFGRLRWVAVRRDLPLDLEVPQFTHERDWTIDESRLLSHAQAQVAESVLLSEHVATLPQADPWYTVHGKDLLVLLRIGLRRTLGRLPATVGVAQLARSLRLAMSDDDLQATNMWRDMRKWEGLNPPYLVLPQPDVGEEDIN